MIGGLLGFLVAGPGGCLLGILIGHIFDQHLTPPTYSQTHQDFWLKFKRRLHENSPPQSDSELSFGLKKAYQTLQLPENATHTEIKQAYRKAVHRYHPDRLTKQDYSSHQDVHQ